MSTYIAALLAIGTGLMLLSRLILLDWWANSSSVRSRLKRADRNLFSEFENARRAMNDAAGQSWRNLTD